MKMILCAAALSFCTLTAFAGEGSQAKSSVTAIPNTQAAPASQKVAKAAPLSKEEAAKACRSEGKKGKDYQTCMEDKTGETGSSTQGSHH